MGRNLDKDSIVPTGVQLNLHHPCAAARERRQHHNIYIYYIYKSSNVNHLNLNLYAELQEKGKRLLPHGFHQLGFLLM